MIEANATFICGHPKSGTSLLRGMLDSHPQLIVFPEETKFFRRVLPASAGLDPEACVRLVGERVLGVFQWRPDSPSATQAGFLDRDYSHVDQEAVFRAYRRRAAGWHGAAGLLLPVAILSYGEGSGRLGPRSRRWVEKSPYNERFAATIFSWWPDARCVHIVRDPRDNHASYRRKHPEWTPAVFAASWLQSARDGWKNQARYGARRYRVFRYEDLVLHTDSTIAEMARFLDIEDLETMRSPTRDGRAWSGNSMFGEAFEGISRNPVGRYAQSLPESHVRQIEILLGPEMRRLSYPLTRPLTVEERLRGRVARAKWAWSSFRSRWLRPRPAAAGAPGA